MFQSNRTEYINIKHLSGCFFYAKKEVTQCTDEYHHSTLTACFFNTKIPINYDLERNDKMKLNFNFSGKTLLKDWWKIVRDNFTTIQTDHNTLSDKLDTEITQRTNADVGLANQIAAEKTARESADSSLSSRISNEVTIRQAADNELQRNIDSEITERQTADSKKADKTELYGTDETTKHTVTYSLTAADMAVSIDAGHSTGTVTVAGNTVKSKILLDGYSIQAADLSATFGCGKGEDGDKYICIYYSPETGTLTMTVEDVETSPEEGTIALMTVGYNTATVTTMYNRAQTFTGINNLNGLKTNNKNSFLEAVNEIATKLTTEISDRMDENDSLSDRINTETGERQAADMQLSARINAIGNKAPQNHASTGTTYGVGDATNYGHLKLSDSVSSSNSTGNGCAATPKATKTAYDKAVEAYELADGKLDANFVSNDYAGIDEVTTTLSDMWGDRVAPPTTITISSSTSKHMLTADYYCSGTNDQTVINNAISALPSTGGKIVLLEGTYNISGQINVNKPNVTICGMGNSTVLECKQGIWGIAATQTNFTIANLKMTFDTYNGNGTSICIYASGSRCKFENLDLSNAVYGINCGGGYSIIHKVTATVNRTNIHLGSGHNVVSDCYSENAKETGIRVEGEYNIVTGCHISDNATYGILVTGGGKNKIAGNIIKRDSYSDSQYSIYVTSSTYNSCSDNIMIGKNYTNAGGTTNTFDSNKY
jgi:parallel beta-helix repeat protein